MRRARRGGKCAAFVALVFMGKAAWSEDFPETRLLRGTTGDDAVLLECAPPTASTLDCSVTRTLVRHSALEERRCRISSERFKQVFTAVAAGAGWISHESPVSACGVTTVSTLQRAAKNSTHWTYTTRKIVTKRDEMLGDLLSCRAVDETLHTYEISFSYAFMGCDYITFEYSPTLP